MQEFVIRFGNPKENKSSDTKSQTSTHFHMGFVVEDKRQIGLGPLGQTRWVSVSTEF